MSFKVAKIGLVPQHWDVTELRDFLERITYGFTNPMPDTTDGPWKITAKDVVNGYINYETARKTSIDDFVNKLTDKSRPNKGDVLLTKDGSIGRVAVVDRSGICINQSVALLQPNNKIDPYFLKYLLLAPYYQQVMENDSDGSTIKHIYITRVDKMEVAVPPLREQKEILRIIKTIDDKITLNRQINQTLEAMAQALFKSWFVDFEPVRAKVAALETGEDPTQAAMRAISGKTDDELGTLQTTNPAAYEQLHTTATLFPAAFVESELGLIPEGWEVGKLGNIAKAKGGYAFKSAEFIGEGIPVIKIKNIKDNGTVDIDDCEFISPNTTTKASAFLIKSGRLLMAMTGATVGKSGILVSEQPVFLNQRVAMFVSKKFGERIDYFLFCAFRRSDIFDQIIANAQGSAQPNVSSTGIESAKLVVASAGIIDMFCSSVDSFFQQRSQNIEQICSLANLRGTLLPKLLSGELTVGEAMDEVGNPALSGQAVPEALF